MFVARNEILQPKVLAEVYSTDVRIVENALCVALSNHTALADYVGPLTDVERFADIVVCD
jgi:hypothetical protein